MSISVIAPQLALYVLGAVAAGPARSRRSKSAGGGDRTRFVPVRHFCRRDRALDEAAAEHARLAFGRIVEHAGLARRYSVFAGDEVDLDPLAAPAQPGRLRRPRGADLDEDLVPAGAQRGGARVPAQPPEGAQ